MSKLPLFALVIVLIGFYVLGYGHLYSVITEQLQDQEAAIFFSFLSESVYPFLGQYGSLLVSGGLGIIVLSGLAIFITMALMRRYARVVMIASIYLFAVFMLVMTVVLFFVNFLGALFMGLVTAVWFFIILFRRERIRLAGIFLQMSSQALYREKQILLVSGLLMIFSVFTAIADIGVLMYVWGFLGGGELVDFVILFVAFFAAAWISFSALYLAEGVVVQIVHDWYRNPEKDVATLGKGIAVAFERSGPIITLSFFMALLAALRRTLRTQARRSEGGGAALFYMIGAIVSAIAQGIAEFITYFTLPAIIIEKKNFKDGVKRSASLVWRHWIDVILSNSGMSIALIIFSLPVLFLFGSIGYVVGLLVFPTVGFWAGVVLAVVFVIFGFVPLYVVFHFLYAIYKTILYEYALDCEEGFKRPSTLPQEVKTEFENLAQSGGKRSIPEPKW